MCTQAPAIFVSEVLHRALYFANLSEMVFATTAFVAVAAGSCCSVYAISFGFGTVLAVSVAVSAACTSPYPAASGLLNTFWGNMSLFDVVMKKRKKKKKLG